MRTTWRPALFVMEAYFDTRGLELALDESISGQVTFSLPGFLPVVVGRNFENLPTYVYNGRDLWLIPALYQQFLGRDADEGGFGFWYDQLWDGLPNSGMVASLLRLPEHASLTVDHEYQHILDRNPDPQGRSYWASYLGAGGSPDALRSLLYGSPEYLTRAGGTTDGFHDALYKDVLGRAPDAGGRAYWRDLIDTGRLTRSAMAFVVLNLDEPIEVGITRLYADLLDRAPTGGELGFWRPAWRQIGEFGVIASIAGSDEYYEHVAPLDPAHPYYFTDASQATAAAYDDLVQAAAEPVEADS
jgi:hypothetical protein